MLYFHASPLSNLGVIGLKSLSKPCVSRRRSPYIWLGTLLYLHSNYFHYCPRGTYFIYQVDVQGLALLYGGPGGQVKTAAKIPGARLKLYAERIV